MKTKVPSLLCVFGLFLLGLSDCLACASSGAVVVLKARCQEMKSEVSQLSDGRKDRAEYSLFRISDDPQKIISQLRGLPKECRITEANIKTIQLFLKPGFSVVEQTEEEYRTFLREVKEKHQGVPDNCLLYKDITRVDRFTAYYITGARYSEYPEGSGKWVCLLPMC